MATAIMTEREVDTSHHRFLLPDIGWEGYEKLLELIGDRRSVRLAYYKGSVEFMSPLPKHERFGYLIGRMVQEIAFGLGIPIYGTRSTTYRRRVGDSGLEADDSYYLGANVGQIPRTGNLELDQILPPDLAIEIEITNSILDRLGIYAALGVPELWRFDGERLIVLLLQPDGRYIPSPTSLAFPYLPLGEMTRFIAENEDGDDNLWIARFRAWVNDVLLPLYQNHGA